MNHVFLFVLLCITFALGLVVGDAWTPLSGASVHALSVRCAELEARATELEARCAKLEGSLNETKTRFEAWLGDRPLSLADDDGGTRLIIMGL